MSDTIKLSTLLTALCALALSGCPDPAPPKVTDDGGAEGGGLIIEQDMDPMPGGEAPPTVDMMPEDMELPIDMMVQDMEPPVDMMTPDMEPPIPVYMGAACVEDSECASHEHCIFGSCSFDLRPAVYRMRGGEVFEPAGPTGNLLELLLNNSVQNEVLNLMFEPGFYTEDGQAYWFIGNGLPSTEGYVFRRNFPIQNFLGAWLESAQEGEPSAPMWRLEGQRPFILAVPTGIVSPADTERYGESFQCTTTFPTTVNVTITPERDEPEGSFVRIKVDTDGYLKRADIEQINILFNGNEINFIDYFANVELVDLDGDGEAQEYPFHLEVEATPISFLEEPARPDRLDLRDPSPLVDQPPECEGL
jgi:hypothetical protein